MSSPGSFPTTPSVADRACLRPIRSPKLRPSSVVVIFLGYVSGTSIFSALVTWTDGYRMPFISVAGQLAVMTVVQVIVLARRARTVS